jgi:hypothetical protein
MQEVECMAYETAHAAEPFGVFPYRCLPDISLFHKLHDDAQTDTQ